MSAPEAEASRRRARRGRAYFFLVLFCLCGMGANLLWSVHLADQAQQQNRETRQALCGVVGPFANVPVPRPANPKAKPASEAAYEWHQRFVTLSHEFDC
jgi:hypothetical protein